MNSLVRYVPWAVFGTGLLYVVMAMLPHSSGSDDAMHLDDFARVPIADHGRIKPIDTLARNTLMIISGEQSYRDKKDNRHSAVEWLLDVVTAPLDADRRPVFTITNEQLINLLKLKPRPNFRFCVADLGAMFNRLIEIAPQLNRMAPDQRDELSEALLDLGRQCVVFDRFGRYATAHHVFRIDHDQVRSLLGLEARDGFRYGFDEFYARLPELIREVNEVKDADTNKEHAKYVKSLQNLFTHVELYIGLARLDTDTLRVVPPAEEGTHDWLKFEDALRMDNPSAQQFDRILSAYAAKDAKAFNKELDTYRAGVDKEFPKETSVAGFEVFFNHFSPFVHCEVLYIIVGILSIVGWVIWPQPLIRSATLLAFLTLAVHSTALLARMYIQGRPPVTNLYSSAVFVGWGCLGLALTLEMIYRNGIGNVVAAVLGFVTMFFANYLAASGDTLEMLEAVLDTNIWLATHVVCIALGYTATGVAGVLGLLYVILGVATRNLDQPMRKSLAQMIYGVVCFAMLLSFVGTVLGGIWADQSWGRFWGWDPKENGAVLIVIWNALILHARWGGMVKQRGMALLAIAGNMVVGWSWIGTNQLGVGLHAYGFNNTLAKYLVISWIVHLVVLGAGLIPTRYWLSFNVPEVSLAGAPTTRPSSYSTGSKLQPAK
jgi:ABC-type transport system involved in cytochrome c biogenesis permease subunit